MQYYLAVLHFLIKQRSVKGIEPETLTIVGKVFKTTKYTWLLTLLTCVSSKYTW